MNNTVLTNSESLSALTNSESLSAKKVWTTPEMSIITKEETRMDLAGASDDGGLFS